MAREPVLAWLLAALSAAAVALALRESFAGMAFQWQSSSTFSYGVLILPISLFLLWRERARLARVRPEPGWIALALMVPLGLTWVLGVLLDLNVVHHFAAVLLVILAVWAVLGTPAAKVIWFPLGYLLLMVPFGEFLVPTLMQWTADFAVIGVALSGVPVFQDGFVFSLPGGDFEVIKACSGIRFLMATVAAGAVFAWVAYNSWRKRLLFLLACLMVPVLGNLLRAYLVVMLVHLSDGRLAGDHVTYGMIFFGAILLTMFVVGARYADPAKPVRGGLETAGAGASAGRVLPAAIVGALMAFVIAVLPGELRDRAVSAGTADLLPLPAALTGYRSTAGAAPEWQPKLRGSTRASLVRYRPEAPGRTVDAFVAVYEPAAGNGELTDSRNRLFDPRVWRKAGGDPARDYTEAVIRPAPGSEVPAGEARVVWSWYVVNGVATNSRLVAKLRELQGLISGGGSSQAIVALSATFDAESDAAREGLRVFAPPFCASSGLPCPADFGRPVR